MNEDEIKNDLFEKWLKSKVSTTVYLERLQDDDLKKLSSITKVPMAQYIREGVDLVIEKHKHLLREE